MTDTKTRQRCEHCGASRDDQVQTSYYSDDHKALCTACWTAAYGKDLERVSPATPGLLGHATDAECIADCIARIGHLEMVMRECCDSIRDNDEFAALKMLEVALQVGSHHAR